MIGYVAVLGVGYVLGTKAGRRRYEQIVGTYRALTGSPVARSMIEGGRRKIANRISPDTGFVTVTEIDSRTAVMEHRARGNQVDDDVDIAGVNPPVNASR